MKYLNMSTMNEMLQTVVNTTDTDFALVYINMQLMKPHKRKPQELIFTYSRTTGGSDPPGL